MPRRRCRRRVTCVLALGICANVATGCAHRRTARSYFPVGARASYGANTNDGVTWTAARPLAQASETVIAALRAEGFVLDVGSSSTRNILTMPRSPGGDTSLLVRAQLLSIELPEDGTSIVLTATYSVPSRRIHDAAVIQPANTINPLYARLLAVANVSRRTVGCIGHR